MSGLRFFLIAISIVSSVSTLAAEGVEQPLLTKTDHSGYVPGWLRHFVKCEVFANRVVVQENFDRVGVSRETTVTLTGNLRELVLEAEKGPFEERVGPTDGPSHVWTAYLPAEKEGEQGKTVTLRSLSDRQRINLSRAADTLVRYLDSLCR